MKSFCMTVMLLAGVLPVVTQAEAEKPAETKKAVVIKDQMSLADARGQIDKIISSKTTDLMKSVMKRLSAEDQKQFLADVNKAISEMPASTEEKTALYLNINHAAVVSAQEGNTETLIAETFATVPPESLTVVCERFAVQLVNRTANAQVTYTDAQFSEKALSLMKVINARTAETDNGSVRSAFAIIMLIRASNGSPADLTDKLIDTLASDEAKELAKSEWIPSALGKDGREKGYESLLASADAGRRPDYDFTLVIAGPQYLESVLQDIGGKNVDEKSFIATRTPVLDAVENPLRFQVPNIGSGEASSGGDLKPSPSEPRPTPGQEEEEEEPEPTPPEPGPYDGQ